MPKYKVPNWGPDGRPERLNSSTTSMGTIVPAGITPPIPLQHAGDLGVVYEEGTKRWQIFEVVDAQNGAAGDVMYVKNYAAYTATPTIGNSSQNEPAGIAELQYTTPSATVRVAVALRIGGVMSVKSADASINARGLYVISDTANNRVILQAADTNAAQTKIRQIGIAQAAQAAGFVSVFLILQPV